MKVIVGGGCRGKDQDEVWEGRASGRQKRHLFRRSGAEVRKVRNGPETIGDGLQDRQAEEIQEQHTQTRAGEAAAVTPGTLKAERRRDARRIE